MYEIDLDTETLWYDGAWQSRDDLARKIRSMIDAGDYRVAQPSQALEFLTQSVANARAITVRLPAEVADALTALGQRDGRPVGALVREAIAAVLGKHGAAPAATALAATPGAAATAGVETAPASPEEAATAVTMTPKKKESEPERKDVEKRWFGR